MRRLLLALLLCGCAAEEPERYDLRVSAISDEGQTLSGLLVRADGRVIGRTDDAGRLSFNMPGAEGRHVDVTVDAPPGYRGGPQTRSIVLDHLVRRADGQRSPIEVSTRFAPRQRSYVLLVGVGVPALPVEIFGVQKATTNSEGVAMLLVPGAPGDDLQVRVTNAQRRDLQPAFLAHTFTLADHADALVFDGHFTELKKRIPPPQRPQRL